MAPTNPAQVKGSGFDLPRPFDQGDHRILAKKVEKLIKKRNKASKKMRALDKMVTTDEASAQLQREQQEELQRKSRQMMKREQKFKSRQLTALEEREELLKADPSNPRRTQDVHLLKTMLAKLDHSETPKLSKSPKQKACHHAADKFSSFLSSCSNYDSENLVSDNDYHSSVEPDLGTPVKSVRSTF